MRRVLLLLAPLLIASCTPVHEPTPVADTRDATLTSCPRPTSTGVPADLPFADRETLNLGDGVLGHKLIYQRTRARRVVLSVGADPLDALEDLDMNASDTVVGGRAVVLSTTRLQPSLAVIEVPSDLPPECGQLVVLTERLTPAERDDVVRSLHLEAPGPTEAPA